MRALILIDIQNDFLPGGALAVPQGDQVIAVANALQKKFQLAVATQDWHPKDHGSFAANHPDKKPGDIVELSGQEQILWPVHCVQGTPGAKFAQKLSVEGMARIFKKGTDPTIDSYSGFFDNGKRKATGLGDYLKSENVSEVYLVGLAADYCVKFTALDAVSLGLKTYLVEDGTRGVDLNPGDVAKSLTELLEAGVNIINSKDIS